MWKPFKGLDDAEIHLAQANLNDYRYAEELTGVPWAMLAGIHFREHGLHRDNPSGVPGGPFQFDPSPSEKVLAALMTRFIAPNRLAQAERTALLKGSITLFESACVFAACWLQEKVQGQLKPDSPDEIIKTAFWGYNGKVNGSPDHSAYVMNGYDAAHYPMPLSGTIAGRWVHIQDTRAGAFTVYRQLKALFPKP